LSNLREGKDYTISPDGLLVFTALYLALRGYCCGNGCLNCPYDYEAVPEPRRQQLKEKRNAEKKGGSSAP
jgi:hypothetical protein